MGIFLIIYYSSSTEGQLTMLDVGQGDSILFQTDSKQNIMIDTGGNDRKIISNLTLIFRSTKQFRV